MTLAHPVKNCDVYGIGNALVDTEYEVDDAFLAAAKLPKGMMTLIEAADRDRLVRMLETEHERQVVNRAGGGSAANTIVSIAQCGGRTFYSCKVANDDTGDFFMADLTRAGVATNLAAGRGNGITGRCISMVTPDAERTMTTHLGITAELSVKELNADVLRRSRYLYVEGYLVTSPTAFEAARQAQDIVRSSGGLVSLTLSDPAMVQNFTSAFDELATHGVDLVFCNEEEAMLWTGRPTRVEAMAALTTRCSRVAMTCGRDGAMVHDGAVTTLVPGVPVVAVDTTGAGDIFAGTFLHAIANGRSFTQAAAFANRAASRLVSTFGARLSQSAIDELLPYI
jgi:sugar/nucleoside kinase (ribokinase family)